MPAVNFESVNPIVTVHDVRVALRRYQQLGFDTEHDESADYGFAERGSVQIHLQPGEPDETGGVFTSGYPMPRPCTRSGRLPGLKAASWVPTTHRMACESLFTPTPTASCTKSVHH